jgi:RNA polymerase sigma-70 factor (ECF subfamily)
MHVVDRDELAEQFEQYRPALRSVAYRMLGSLNEAEDAVQEGWLRLDRSDSAAINDLQGWLTVVVGRVCLDMLRARQSRREDYVGPQLPEPLVWSEGTNDPEAQAELADTVGLAMLVVLEALTPAERLAFVLHDVFAVPFEEIAPILDRTPTATRQLASRARRRVQSAVPVPDPDQAAQRRTVDAFLAAAQEGNFDALLELLDPDVTFRVDTGALTPFDGGHLVGADAVARQVLTTAPIFAPNCRKAIVNGSAGFVAVVRGRPIAVVAFIVAGGRIAAIDIVADRRKLQHVAVDAS